MHNYSYRVFYSNDDNEYVGVCTEFPSLSFLDADPVEAISGIKSLVTEVVADMQANGEKIPEPITSKQYSGKFMVRVPPLVHQNLAMHAKEQNVSLNRLVASKLQ